jgi:hypothetical protein
MIDQLPMAVVVVNAPIIGALTTCHPHRCYSPFPKRGCTSCSGTNCRPLRFPNQDLATKEHKTDQPTLDGLFRGLRGDMTGRQRYARQRIALLWEAENLLPLHQCPLSQPWPWTRFAGSG